jgi:hypothetical protein
VAEALAAATREGIGPDAFAPAIKTITLVLPDRSLTRDRTSKVQGPGISAKETAASGQLSAVRNYGNEWDDFVRQVQAGTWVTE